MGNLLHIYTDNAELHRLYVKAAVERDPDDSGFDILTPESVPIEPTNTNLVDSQIQARMFTDGDPQGFLITSRSSISKTPLILHNGVGVIDQGYRGNLKFPLVNIKNVTHVVEPFTSLIQIVHPTLAPFAVTVFTYKLDTDTRRGTGGFGSTGA